MDSVKDRLNVSKEDIKSLKDYVDKYFCDELKLSDESVTRIPGNRHNVEE